MRAKLISTVRDFLEYWHALAIMSGMAVLLFCVCALRFRKKIG